MNLDNIEKLIKLSRIELSEEEEEKLLNDFKAFWIILARLKK